jgi:hypothetical protein
MINVGDVYHCSNARVLEREVIVICSRSISQDSQRKKFSNFKLDYITYDYYFWAYLDANGSFTYNGNNSGKDTISLLHKIGTNYKVSLTEYILYGNKSFSFECINKALESLKD